MNTYDDRNNHADPEARNVDWPTLVGMAERRGIPVLRIDEHGGQHIIRTRAQLEREWGK